MSDLRELRKCRRLATWLATLEATANWVMMSRQLLSLDGAVKPEKLSGVPEMLDGFRRMLGDNVLHLIGVFPLGSGWWFECPLDDEIDPRED